MCIYKGLFPVLLSKAIGTETYKENQRKGRKLIENEYSNTNH